MSRKRPRIKINTNFSRSRSSRRRAKGMQISVASHVMREIWAVIYLALSVLTILSINGQLGFVGTFWNNFLSPIFGWGLYAVPVFLGGIGLALFFSRRVEFEATRILGLILMVAAGLGIIHLSVPQDQIYEVAKAGQYGGYIGFVSSFLGRQILGITGSYVVFIALFIISILLTFSISLREIFSLFEWNWQRPETKEKTFTHSKDESKQAGLDDDMMIHVVKPIGDSSDTDLMTVKMIGDEGDEIVGTTAIGSKNKAFYESEGDAGDDPGEQEKGQSIPVERIVEELEKAEAESEFKEEIPWEFPSLDLLSDETIDIQLNQELLREKAEAIHDKLGQFDIPVKMYDIHVGPTVIQYTLKPHEGIKLSKITTLKNDLALALAAPAIRIEAPIPGKSLVGIEVPNDTRSIVHLREILECEEWKIAQKKNKSKLLLPMGRSVNGKPIIEDLSIMPHLLIAGATGSGKSVATNVFLSAFLYQNSPRELKLILIDPKQVELTAYNGIPHLLTPVITEPEKAAIALRWVVAEMTRRYTVFADAGQRNIQDYNDDPNSPQSMPRIVVLIDELADMMMVAGKEVEASICRIAQMARAVGIHLIVATQRPSVDVITGLIKANIPARIAFTVASSIDSRTILDGIGAEDLLGRGDMLYLSGTMGKPIRVQGVFVSTQEIQKLANRVKLTIDGNEPEYLEDITSRKTAGIKVNGVPKSAIGGDDDDDLYDQALEIVKRTQKASATLLQRHLKIGYSRAARLIDLLEENGVVGPGQGAKPREVFVKGETV